MKNSIRRFIGITSILAMALSVMVLPAAAAPPLASANLAQADRLLKAGETHDFVITFQSNESAGGLPIAQPAGQNIDAIQIATPGSILDWNSVTAPATIGDFDVFVDDGFGRITLHNGILAPGASVQIPFTATVLTTMSGDKSNGFFGVQASAEGDPNFGNVTGNLTSLVDILAVNSIALTAPSSVPGFGSLGIQTGVTDNTVTANQGGISVDVNVSNNSSTTAKDVTVTLTGVPGSPQVTVPVGPSSSATATFTDVVFGSTNTTVDASLDAENADRDASADPAQVAVTVQAAPNINKGSDISPDYVGLGSHNFSVSLSKNNPPAALFDATLTTVHKNTGAAGPSASTTGTVVGRNNQSVVLDLNLDFGELLAGGVPQFPGGMYDATLTLTNAIDDNGKTFTRAPIDLGDIFFDPLAPVFDLLTLEGQPPFAGDRDAVTHDEGFNYSLELHNDGASGDPCAQCDVLVEVFEAANPENVFVTATPTTNNQGLASGTLTAPWPNLSHIDVKLRATASDRGGNDTPATAFATEDGSQEGTSDVKVSMIDTLPPAIDPGSPEVYSETRAIAYTGGYDDLTQAGVQRPQNRMIIDVWFDEPVAAAAELLTRADWQVDNHSVTMVQVVTFGDGSNGVRLTLGEQLGRNERPGVRYERAAVSGTLGNDIRDRVEQNLINGAVQRVIDAILPELPVLDLVDDLERYSDDLYHTNLGHYTGARNDELTPNDDLVLQLINVEGGATVVVREAGSDNELARVENASTEETITQEVRIPRSAVPGIPATGATSLLNLEIFAMDAEGNTSPVGTDTINLDLDAPGSNGVTAVDVGANSVTIAADEDLRFGRNNDPENWAVRVTWDGDPFLFNVQSVSDGDTPAERVLQVNSGSSLADVDSVDFARLSYIGSDADGRLRDPAGNRLPLVLHFNNGG